MSGLTNSLLYPILACDPCAYASAAGGYECRYGGYGCSNGGYGVYGCVNGGYGKRSADAEAVQLKLMLSQDTMVDMDVAMVVMEVMATVKVDMMVMARLWGI